MLSLGCISFACNCILWSDQITPLRNLFNSPKNMILPQILRFSLIVFYGISTIVGYLMQNPHYTYILNIYELFWLGFMTYQQL